MSFFGEKRTDAHWFTSSYSTGSQACVEVALTTDATGVRDTKDRDGGTLDFKRTQWTSFVNSIKGQAIS